MEPTIRPARPEDAAILAELENRASGGMSHLLWSRDAAPGQDPFEVGQALIRGTEDMTSHRNVRVAELAGEVVGALFVHGPGLAGAPIPSDCPTFVRPLLELAAQAPGAGYIDLLATTAAAQGQGVGGRLLEHAWSEFAGPGGLCLVVSDDNLGARRFYERHGFRDAASQPIVKEDWQAAGRDWILMVKR